MGKFKREARKHSNHHDNPQRSKPSVQRRQHSQQGHPAKGTVKDKKKTRHPSPRPKIPFNKHDNILLIGEGDFSFALSLARHYNPANIIATCYDDEETLQQKHPQISRTISALTDTSNPAELSDNTSDWEGLSPQPDLLVQEVTIIDAEVNKAKRSPCQVLFKIDATKLSSAHKKVFRPFSPFSKIVFNFPHVGGISTDVNRQVRANQQLLVGFFEAAKPLLCSLRNPLKIPARTNDTFEGDEDMHYASNSDANDDSQEPTQLKGQILVTMFEGEPYTLWNIRDLARHSGLQVVESFKFPWSAYPGYHHARTLGDIVSGKDGADGARKKGAWKGEERDARCYVLETKDQEDRFYQIHTKKMSRDQDEEND